MKIILLISRKTISFYAGLDSMNFVSAKTIGMMAITLPSETIFSYGLKGNLVFGIPISVSSGALAINTDRLQTLAKALDGDQAKPKQFFLTLGMNSSTLEHSVLEQLFSTPENPAEGISALKALKIANDQGIPIYTINQENINTIFPQLQVDADVKADIVNAVSAGEEVTVSKTNITYNGWTGCGYIIIAPDTGAGAYMISGEMNGGVLILAEIINWLFALFISDVEAVDHIASSSEIDCAYFHFIEYLGCLATNIDFVQLNQMALMIAFGVLSKSILKWHPWYSYICALLFYIGVIFYLCSISYKCGQEATYCD